MEDIAKLEQILKTRHPCISMVTQEEEYALEVIQSAVLCQKCDLLLWSESEGIRGGLFEDTEEDKILREDTENPNVALVSLKQLKPRAVCVFQDLGPHLKYPKTCRLLHDLIVTFKLEGRTLILLDHEALIPAVILAQTREFELSLPDENNIKQIVKTTLKKYGGTHDLEITVSKRGYEAKKTDATTESLLSVIEQSVPLSVTMAKHMQALRQWAQTRCVPAD